MSRDRRRPLLVLTCEHGGNHVPARYASLFAGAGRVLRSHRGHDPGAREVAQAMARRLGVPLFLNRNSRLLVDLNRSHRHPALLSRWTRALDASARQRLLQRHYLPHRAAVTRALRRRLAGGRRAVHVAVHSFVPVLGGVRRRADVGLLYDPRRGLERAVCRAWRRQLGTAGPRWRVRCNYPYRGVSDGLTTALRRTLGSPRYAGIELEINQALFRRRRPEELAAIFAATLEAALRDAAGPSA